MGMNNRDIYAHKYVHAYVRVLTYACTQSTHAYLSCNVGIPWKDIIVIWGIGKLFDYRFTVTCMVWVMLSPP